MAKFYVQSGSLRAIVDSADAERAALWAIHTAMEPILSLESDDSQLSSASSFERNSHPQSQSSSQPHQHVALGETIQLSELGFDREDAMRVSTFEAFRHWNDLWFAMERLERALFHRT